MLELPDSLEACHTLIEQTNDTNASLAKDLERLKFEYEQLKRYLYGRRSERHVEDDSQLSLFDEGEGDEGEEAADADEKVIEITYERRQRSKKDRFPESLPREVEVIDVPEAERLCACCGDEMPIIAAVPPGRRKFSRKNVNRADVAGQGARRGSLQHVFLSRKSPAGWPRKVFS